MEGATLWPAVFGVGLGAMAGAWLRWTLGGWFNSVWQGFALGTLAANWLGCMLIGMVFALPNLSALWRVILVTGFLGGLTTFSSFSAEGFALIERNAWLLLALQMLAHIAGGWFMFWLGWRIMSRLAG